LNGGNMDFDNSFEDITDSLHEESNLPTLSWMSLTYRMTRCLYHLGQITPSCTVHQRFKREDLNLNYSDGKQKARNRVQSGHMIFEQSKAKKKLMLLDSEAICEYVMVLMTSSSAWSRLKW